MVYRLYCSRGPLVNGNAFCVHPCPGFYHGKTAPWCWLQFKEPRMSTILCVVFKYGWGRWCLEDVVFVHPCPRSLPWEKPPMVVVTVQGPPLAANWVAI